MSAAPTGTVTFLFTDIEGSTRLWEQHPETMRAALVRHDALLRDAIAQNEGYLVKSTGDGVHGAFATAADAVQAALAAQCALHRESWPQDACLRVRIGVHTGAADFRDGDYFGPALNRTARLMTAGHGGQILLSQAAVELCRDELPPGVSLKDLGEHQLKDLNRPETVYQLLHPDLPENFPALRTLDDPAFPHNLPRQLTSFIGREKEIAQIECLLEKTNLLTLTGAGGSGKTRLSLQVAADVLGNYPDGAWFVELAPLSDPELVTATVAATLGIKEQPGKTYIQILVDYLHSKRLLLVLDNCEHVLSACAALADTILRACPQVTLLASSREAMGIAGEQTFRVPSLSLPDRARPLTAEQLSQYEAARLFIERAASSKADFAITSENAPALVSVCYRLDGIPFAIELAAARIKSMSVVEINNRLDNRFRLLTGGSKTALPRQQTLRALIDWSYDLLNEQEKRLLWRLSVFSGGWTLESAEQVCSDEVIAEWDVLDLLTTLVDRSLVLAEQQQESTRYRMLETVRHYATERLVESGEGLIVRERHRNHFLALAEEAEPHLREREQIPWLETLEAEHDNLRQAIAFSQDDEEGTVLGLRLAAALSWFWYVHGHLSEGRRHLAEALARSIDARVDSHLQLVRARALLGAGHLAALQGDQSAARVLLEEGLALFQQLGDKTGMALAFNSLGLPVFAQGDVVSARAFLNKSLALAREIDDRWTIANCLACLAFIAFNQGDYNGSRSLSEESLAIFRELGDRRGIVGCLTYLGTSALRHGDYDDARILLEESIALSRALGDRPGIAYSLTVLGEVAEHLRDYDAALALFDECLTLYQELGNRQGIASAIFDRGRIALFQGDYAVARRRFNEGLALHRELGDKWGMARSLRHLATTALRQCDYDSAPPMLEESLSAFRELGGERGIAYCLDAFAELAHGHDQAIRAARLAGAVTSLRGRISMPRHPVDEERFAQITGWARQRLGDVTFDAVFAEGHAMTIEQAIEYALTPATLSQSHSLGA